MIGQFGRYRTAIVDSTDSLDLEPMRYHTEHVGARLVEIFYAPFDYVNKEARVVITGITPGPTQMQASIATAKKVIQRGDADATALREAKLAASFSGAMRRPLIQMLDEIGLHTALGIKSTAEFWLPDSSLAHFTSVLRYPTFVDGKYYGGSNPKITSPLFGRIASKLFQPEVDEIVSEYPEKAVFVVSLGKSGELVDEVLRPVFRPNLRRLRLPHPSGENQPDLNVFLGRSYPRDYDNPRSRARAERSLKMRTKAISELARSTPAT